MPFIAAFCYSMWHVAFIIEIIVPPKISFRAMEFSSNSPKLDGLATLPGVPRSQEEMPLNISSPFQSPFGERVGTLPCERGLRNEGKRESYPPPRLTPC